MRGGTKLLFTAIAIAGCVGQVPDDPRRGDDDDDDIGLGPDAMTPPVSADARPPGAPDANSTPPPDAAPLPRSYPAGPYGTSTGDVIANLSWTGYADDDGNGNPFDDAPRTIELGEVFDGADPGAKLIFVNSSAGWCGSCQEEAAALPGLHAEYGPRGVRFVSALFETTTGAAATTSFIREWGETFDLPIRTVADPSDALGPYYESSGVPMNMLVDAETMEILEVHHGFDGWYVRSLLDANLD